MDRQNFMNCIFYRVYDKTVTLYRIELLMKTTYMILRLIFHGSLITSREFGVATPL